MGEVWYLRVICDEKKWLVGMNPAGSNKTVEEVGYGVSVLKV